MNDAYFSKWHCHKIYSCRSNLRQLRPNSTCCVTSRHDTTRYLAHVFWHRKKSWRAASRLSDSTARHARHDKRDNCDSHDTCSGSPPQCGLGWTSPPHFFQKLFLRLTQIQSTEDKLLHASTTASSSSAMLEQSRRYTHEMRDTLLTTRATRMCRDATCGIWDLVAQICRVIVVSWNGIEMSDSFPLLWR